MRTKIITTINPIIAEEFFESRRKTTENWFCFFIVPGVAAIPEGLSMMAPFVFAGKLRFDSRVN